MDVLKLILPEIREMLSERNFRDLRRSLESVDPRDLADDWDEFTPSEQAVLFRILPRRQAAILFEELEPEEQETLFRHIREVDMKELFSDLDPSETSQFLRELPRRMVKRLLALMNRERVKRVEQLLEYPEESVGSHMRAMFFTVREDWTCREALEKLRASVRLKHSENYHLRELYVTRANGSLVGKIYLKELVIAPDRLKVIELAHRVPAVLYPTMDQEEAAQTFQHYKLTSAPVVDVENRIVGVVVADDVYDILEEETEEDFAKMAGMASEAADYHDASVVDAAKVRLPWLLTTCLGQLVVSGIVHAHQETLSHIVALATFMPFIAAMGGNVGGQSGTLMVRGLATGDLEEEDFRASFFKETLLGLSLGAFYGVIIGTVAYTMYPELGSHFAIVVGTGMVVSMLVATAAGSFAPFLFHKIGFDPATATSPLISTVTDISSTLTYFTFAAWYLL